MRGFPFRDETGVSRQFPAAAATREAANLVAQIEAAGYPARLMVEPSPQPEVLVVIAFDQRGGTEIQDGTEIAVTR